MQQLKQYVFREYRDFLYESTGIYLGENKRHLLESKLNRLLSRYQLESAAEYLQLISRPENAEERQVFINMMAINTTEFFRESRHFEFLQQQIDFILKRNPRIDAYKKIRVWSAACSSGQEPLSLAMVLKGVLGDGYAVQILATDISTRALSKAVSGVYSANECVGIPDYYLKKYFTKQGEEYTVREEIRSIISYRQFNLKENIHFKWGFDIIFCRNVMIYFDPSMQQQLTDRFYRHLVSEGLFFLGHSESLINKKHRFKSIGHSIYLKP